MKLQTWKRAQNLPVASLDEGAQVGRLDDFQFDLEDRRIYGWRLKGHGVFAKAGGVSAQHLTLIGRDLAFISSEEAVEWTGGRPSAVDGRAWANAYVGTQVITRRGRSLGTVMDFVLDRQGHCITGMMLQGNQLVALDDRVHAGPAAVIVSDPEAIVNLPDEDDDGADWWKRLKGALSKVDDAPAIAAEE